MVLEQLSSHSFDGCWLPAFIVVGGESPFCRLPGYFLLTLTFWLAVPVSPAMSVTVTVKVKFPVRL